MAIKTRSDRLPFWTNIDSTKLVRASRLLASTTGFSVQPNKAIVGANAFAHESGIHQDGMLKNAETYEIMTPESVGWTESNLVMGKHSGRHAFKSKLEELGYGELGDNAFQDAFNRFKDLADHKKEITDEDLIALVDDAAVRINDRIQFESLKVHSIEHGRAKIEIGVTIDGQSQTIAEEGSGAVDGIFKALKPLSGSQPSLKVYQVGAVTGGTDAQAKVTVRLEEDGRSSMAKGLIMIRSLPLPGPISMP